MKNKSSNAGKIIRFIICLLFPSFGFCQVTGIGIFKIGNSKQFILGEIKKTTGIELKIYDNVDDEIKNKKDNENKTVSVTSLNGKIAFAKFKSLKFDSLIQMENPF